MYFLDSFAQVCILMHNLPDEPSPVLKESKDLSPDSHVIEASAALMATDGRMVINGPEIIKKSLTLDDRNEIRG